MGDTAKWIDRGAIVDLLYRYATAIDTRDWPLLRSCFADDSKLDYSEPDHHLLGFRCDQCGEEIALWESADAVTKHFSHSHDGYSHTQHRITNPVIELTGSSAQVLSYVISKRSYTNIHDNFPQPTD